MTISKNQDFAPESTSYDRTTFDETKCDIELREHLGMLKKIGGSVLDLAAGSLRNSRLFAAHDMRVYAVDQNEAALAGGLAKIEDSSVRDKITVAQADVRDFAANNIPGPYDVVVMSEYLNHAGSRMAALEAARLGFDNVKPGGFMWIRAVSVLDDSYRHLQRLAERDSGMRGLDNHTFHASCNCSGESKIEPLTYLEPYDLHDVLDLDDSQVVYERIKPTVGYPNMMGGATIRNFQQSGKTYGQLSLLAQKPE